MLYVRFPLSFRNVEDLLHFNQDCWWSKRDYFKLNRAAALAEWRQLLSALI
jgi:hypothetical protein